MHCPINANLRDHFRNYVCDYLIMITRHHTDIPYFLGQANRHGYILQIVNYNLRCFVHATLQCNRMRALEFNCVKTHPHELPRHESTRSCAITGILVCVVCHPLHKFDPQLSVPVAKKNRFDHSDSVLGNLRITAFIF